ncbi:uncharacterized protein G2W53_011339 [Senna tora]|uniref:Uncharacterized protein n=1 Tax=Senna tora TaxID=362788 RepID=A0A834X130_9FABA|nr:uncharacterized protein G2W53_011339 [Senna tora]
MRHDVTTITVHQAKIDSKNRGGKGAIDPIFDNARR